MTTPAPAPTSPVTLREATRVWWAVSLQSFGGTAGHIAVMHRTLVDERRWLGERRFAHALSFCMLLPGPEAQQLATYTGWLLNGTRGALVAGGLFVLPGAAVMLAVSALYVAAGDAGAVEAVFAGIGPAVIAVVAQAVWRLARRALRDRVALALAASAFAALALFGVPFPLVVVGAAAVSLLVGGRGRPAGTAPEPGEDADPPLIPDDALAHAAPSWRRSLLVLAVGVPAWLLPVALVALAWGGDHVAAQQGRFFAGSALLTFGGAYAVLSYVAQRAVEAYAWISPQDMVRGLGLAETTPGPLILVVQFVAFVGAYGHAGDVDPWLAATVAAVVTTWVTFVPSFLFILLGAPFVERLRGNVRLTRALDGVAAAVVGVMANLGLYLVVHTVFAESRLRGPEPLRVLVPELGSWRPGAVAVALVAGWLLLRRGWSVLRVVGVGAAAGLLLAGASALAG
ncbi:MAG: chromate efflux transporter [Kineosporiaceae bacterium]